MKLDVVPITPTVIVENFPPHSQPYVNSDGKKNKQKSEIKIMQLTYVTVVELEQTP